MPDSDTEGEGEGGGGEGFEDIEFELVDGDKEGTKWLIINQVHILYNHKSRDTKKSSGWECSGRRRLGCEFRMDFRTSLSTNLSGYCLQSLLSSSFC